MIGIELITFIVMIAVFLAGCFALKLPVSISMVLSAIAGSLVGGQGIAIRHMVEGMFSYVDTILVIAAAMIFMKAVQECGTLDAVASLIIEKFHKMPAIMLCLIMLIIMFPGMITPTYVGHPEEDNSYIREAIAHYSAMSDVHAWKMPGAGGGGYLALVVTDAKTFVESHPEAFELHIRRE